MEQKPALLIGGEVFIASCHGCSWRRFVVVGSKLTTRAMSEQFCGTIKCEWPVEGAVITLRLDKDRLTS